MTTPLRVLIVEDDETAANLLRQMLERTGHPARIRIVGTLDAALAEVQDADVVFLDLTLPDANPNETISKLVSTGRTAALLVVSGVADRDVMWRAGFDGADDYLVKPLAPDQVLASMTCAMGRAAAARERAQKLRDDLTESINGLKATRARHAE